MTSSHGRARKGLYGTGSIAYTEGVSTTFTDREREMSLRLGDTDKRGIKAIGLSVDPVTSHKGWAADIKALKPYPRLTPQPK